jgi:hypothetical protein
MSTFDAAKLFLGHLLYLNASVRERKRGLYAPNCSEDEFREAVEILKKFRNGKQNEPNEIAGGYIILAALAAAKEW